MKSLRITRQLLWANRWLWLLLVLWPWGMAAILLVASLIVRRVWQAFAPVVDLPGGKGAEKRLATRRFLGVRVRSAG